jgi:UDP-2,3-diacylglucosamine hydrolase
MGAIYFASDLHLTAVESCAFDQFRQFCGRVAVDGSALYLLGDVFEAYIGDDDDATLLGAVATGLRQLADAGVELAFMHGNRDFLVGGGFAHRCGARLLGDVELIELAGRRTALLHGDTLCSDDVAYQTVRRQLRDPAWQAHFLAQPLAARRAFAAQARAESAAHTATAAAEIMDVNADAVAAVLARTGADWIVHGHTHRPAVHDLGRGRRRIVLGDWPRMASWLRVDDTGAELRFEESTVGV